MFFNDFLFQISETANAESKKTGNAGGRVACALIMRPEDANQPEMMTIIIIVLIVIIVLLLILITALIVYCCKRYVFLLHIGFFAGSNMQCSSVIGFMDSFNYNIQNINIMDLIFIKFCKRIEGFTRGKTIIKHKIVTYI